MHACMHETGYVKLSTDFCTIADSRDTLIKQVFPDVQTQYIKHVCLAERGILGFFFRLDLQLSCFVI